MNLFQEYLQAQSRRYFLSQGRNVLGGAALAGLLGRSMTGNASGAGAVQTHFTPKAKRVIYLHMVGGPAQMDLFDYKPVMQ
ncbi:MAG: sulfatase, partial [Roseibacillus sp.]|nr:sulfatase [Roseibacillus sp.]